MNPPYDVPMSAGVPGATLDQLAICPPNDIKAVEIALERGDVAAVILEPAGGQSGTHADDSGLPPRVAAR